MTEKSNLDLQCPCDKYFMLSVQPNLLRNYHLFFFFTYCLYAGLRIIWYMGRMCSCLKIQCIIKFVFRRTLNCIECCWVFLMEVKMFLLRT
jgi:hypothetical protein